ncbi:pentapeptide repeat-containing protein [Alterisphingorhabdus coralli]|uniref:Lysozyme inhibitor LprI N-terminal domain-containing protein n=1 Tax=Alterisphingorhabdus coralli TaxID=3071408 RepID=A0AA97I166_9SPHN|nr:hypothetical protein [Parasphingorhabdus sp. SCSIO 66989]WOE74435.1 hypothetical protein RB602_11330 [Parasphingorhabdus sp. SCSIO 66989]
MGDIWSATSPEDREFDGNVIDGSEIASVDELVTMLEAIAAPATIITGGDFSSWDFREAKLRRVCFYKTKLTGSNWQEVEARQIGFIEADLGGANMVGAEMPGVLFRNTGLVDTNSTGADFRHGQFDGGWFKAKIDGWRLDNAKLIGFRFACSITLEDGCPVYTGEPGISLARANLTDADLSTYGHYQTVKDALINNTRLSVSQFPEFAEASLIGVVRTRSFSDDILFSPEEMRAIAAASHTVTEADAPSFDCSKASTNVENQICGEYQSELRRKDRDMARLYKRARDARKVSRSSQRKWLRARNDCNFIEFLSDCLNESYDKRIGQLLGALGEQDWLERGEKRLFVDEDLPLPDTVQEAPYYPRLQRALAYESGAHLLLSRDAEGRYSIRGDAVRANGHMCSVGASGTILDAATGWYSVTLEDGSKQPIFRYDNGAIHIIGDGKPSYKRWPEAVNFVGCGARGSFGALVPVTLPENERQHIRNAIANPPN